MSHTKKSKAKKQAHKKAVQKSRFLALSDAANEYGARSFDNYSQIRSLAEQVREGLCAYMQHDKKCVFLVPPQGPFSAQNFGSGAFSVSGKGVLPLEPISFGLAVRVSKSGDFMRMVLHCRKAGDKIFMQIEEDRVYDFDLPLGETELEACFEGLYQYLLQWFTDRVERYDHGNYGSTDIGFDILHIDTEA